VELSFSATIQQIGRHQREFDATMIVSMDAVEDIRRRLRISNLEARLELREIECADLIRKIESPRTSLDERMDARKRRETVLSECSALRADLEDVKRAWESRL
jgi:hypothetical protein